MRAKRSEAMIPSARAPAPSARSNSKARFDVNPRRTSIEERESALYFAVPPRNTSDELTFQRVLAFYETSYDRIESDGGRVVHGNYDHIAAAIKDGKVDYLFGATTKPANVIRNIGDGLRKIALTPMPAELMTFLAETYGYGSGIIPGNTYPKLQSGDVQTTFMETIFMMSADVPEGDAYRVTHALLNHRR